MIRLLGKLVGGTTRTQIRRASQAYLFLLPWLIGLLFFWVGPIIASFYFSFSEYDVLSSPRWVGLQNYQKAFAGDQLFWPSLWRTFQYSFAVVPIGLAGSLCLAILLNRGLPGTNLFRTMFFVPHLVPAVATAMVWKWLLNPSLGPINLGLETIGLEGPGWLTRKEWALPSIIMMNLWGSFGGNQMLIFLAALQGVPQSLTEAAEIDGAGIWARFRHITMPMISPTILFNLILGVIGALKVFTSAHAATQGGPQYATWFIALHIYRHAFMYFQMGYGSALAWVFAVILLILTWVQMTWSNRWVYYAGE